MKVYPQFVAYSLWTSQQELCASCKTHILAQEVTPSCMIDVGLVCLDCSVKTQMIGKDAEVQHAEFEDKTKDVISNS